MLLFVLYGTLVLVDLLIWFCWDFLNLYVIICVIYMFTLILVGMLLLFDLDFLSLYGIICVIYMVC